MSSSRSRARSTIAGNVDVAKLHTIDNALRQEFITWDRLRSRGHRILLGTGAAAHRAPSRPTAPYARLIIAPDQSTNVSKVLSAPSGSQPAPIQTVKTEGEGSAPRTRRRCA